ncbi:hypothetical protein RRG08_022499 [Elysia crispata]|uniref:Uncharacterized protein n=1 Tax=Elysia crispata TaxID=231223 RepID=A0AAE0Z1X3_9GAST|nr:hypothetical protein RRG08_022499 [Elysia crispata]
MPWSMVSAVTQQLITATPVVTDLRQLSKHFQRSHGFHLQTDLMAFIYRPISWLSSTDRSHGFHLQTDLMAFIYRPISWLSSTDRSHGFHLQTDLMAFIYRPISWLSSTDRSHGFHLQTDLMAFIYRPISWLSSTDRSHAHSSSLVPDTDAGVDQEQPAPPCLILLSLSSRTAHSKTSCIHCGLAESTVVCLIPIRTTLVRRSCPYRYSRHEELGFLEMGATFFTFYTMHQTGLGRSLG